MKMFFSACLATLCLLVTGVAAPSDGLLSYWKLDSNTLDTAPSGAVTDNGSWVGSSSYAAGVFGQGLDLTGSNYVAIPTSSDLVKTNSDLSISVWFKVGSWNTNWQCLLSKGEGSNYRIARSGGSPSQLAYAGGAGDISGGAVNDGAWHHAVAVSEHGERTSLYIDGIEVVTGGAPSLGDSALELWLGNNPGSPARHWVGGMDDLGLFDVPLSAFQVAAIHELGSNAEFQYSLEKVMGVFDAHAAGVGSFVVIDGVTWQYASSDPGGVSGFVLLAGDGSGMVPSPGPTIVEFSASPIFIDVGESATLSWQIDPPFTSIAIDQGIGDVAAMTDASGAGSVVVSPTATISYTLTANNVDGSTMASVPVYVGIDPTAPRINEFVADASASGLLDENGLAQDWIELYAPGIADLSTYYLTDDAAVLNKWAFPSMSMAPNSYLVVFASGNNLTVNPSFLHTNFRLSAGGEYFALTRDDGVGGYEVVSEFAPSYPAQFEGFSYGISSDEVTTGYFSSPTASAPNGVAFQGFVEDTGFSVGRGFYEVPQSVAITTLTPGATIRYTTDGSTPTETNGTVYTVPLTISGTTTLRAFAYKAGFESTNVDTQTYIFLEDVRTQFANGAAPGSGWPGGSVNGQVYDYGMDPDVTGTYTAQEMKDALSAIPSMSVVTDLPHLVSSSTGIYSNPGSHGIAWERPSSLELINPDGSTGFQIDCGIRVRGGFSRSPSNPKHAFRFFFRNQYGDGKLKFPLFGREGADQFDKFDLRTSQNYSWAFQGNGSNTFLREVLGRDLQGAIGQPYTRSRYYHLYINGVYWGLYMTQERAESGYGATYFKGASDDFDTVKSAGSSGGYNTEATDGTMAQGSALVPGSDWADLWYQARDLNANPSFDNYMKLQGLNPDGSRNLAYPVLVDVDNLIDYTLIIGYTGNYDAPLSNFVGASNNWFSVRNRVLDDRGVAYFVHDGEHSLGAGGGWSSNDRINTTNGAGSRADYNKSNPAFVHFDLAESTPEYRMRFADRAHRALFNGGVLDTAQVLATMEKRREIVDQVIIAESARWGDSKRAVPFTKNDWLNAVASLTSTVNGRRSVFIGHLQTAGLYPTIEAPVYNQHGGSVPSGFNVVMSSPSGVMYYMVDGTDPREIGGGINPNAMIFDPGSSSVALFSLGDSWSYLDNDTDLGTSEVVVGNGGYDEFNWKHPAYDDGGWAVGAAPLGFGGVGVTLNTTVNGGPTGGRYMATYFRKEFNVTGAAGFSSLNLQIMRDDGVVVYLNGHEVARSNMNVGTVTAETAASASVAGAAESTVFTIAIDPTKLVEGMNVMAIELHQEGLGSSDLGLDVGLSGVSTAAGIPITAPTLLNARSYNSTTGEWSALNSAYFTPGVLASSANIVISEVNYHPYDATAAELANLAVSDEEDFEFIEIMNISNEVVELGGSSFALTPVNDHLEGVEVEFPDGTLIQPGERLLVVANAEAFVIRYPSVAMSKIIGDYSNRLSNTGEWITLLAADGEIIDQFRYNDLAPWPIDADGVGASLVLVDPASDPDPADPASWTVSFVIGGSPGEMDGKAFVGNPMDDLDQDGEVALLEYLQGLSDTVPSAELFSETSVVSEGGDDYLAITFRRDPEAVEATVAVELSFDLDDWSTEGVYVGSTPGIGGVEMLTYRSPNPIDPEVREFVRLRVTLN